MKRKPDKKKLAMLFGLLAAVCLIAWLKPVYTLDKSVLDRLCQRPSVPNRNIFIIAMDDKTLQEYGAITSWSRDIPAKLVEILNQDTDGKPAVIAFDVIYSEKGEAESDERFARACETAGNVVTASNIRFKMSPEMAADGTVTYNPFYAEEILLPYEALRRSCSIGYANTIIDADGYVRRTMAWVDQDGERQYSLASQVYRTYLKSKGEEAVFPKLQENAQYYFTYAGKSGSYTTLSMSDVLDGSVDPRLFADGIVFVGAYAAGTQDSFMPAISHNQQMYGVEIQAMIVEALLEQKTQTDVPLVPYVIASGMVLVLFLLFLWDAKILKASIVYVCVVFLYFAAVVAAYHSGYVIQTLPIPLLCTALYLVKLVYGYVAEVMRRKQVFGAFKKYVAPQIVDKISRKQDFELVLGGENRHIAVLFVDIRGFTTMSEHLQPEEVVEVLNEYLSLATGAIFRHGGTLDKFVGDAAMAVYNAPFDQDDYIYRAVCTAWDMVEGCGAMAEKFKKRFGREVTFGIGIHCGNAVVGNIGCEFRMDYTAIGDTVNTAARLESNAKGGQILISGEVYTAVKDRVTVTPIGEIPLKGKEMGVFVYQIDEVK